jgi:hypothetical protein
VHHIVPGIWSPWENAGARKANSVNWFRIPGSCLILSRLMELYEENGASRGCDIAIWVRRRLLLAFLVPLILPFVAKQVRKACFGGMGSLQDVQLHDAAADERMRALLQDLYRCFS